MRKSLGQQEVLQECFFDRALAGQRMLRARGKEAVAKPSGPLAGGAVHKQIQRILPVCANRRVGNFPKLLLFWKTNLKFRRRVLILEHPHLRNPAGALCGDFQVHHRIRGERHDSMGSGVQIVFKAVAVCKPKEIHVSVGQNLIKQQINRTCLRAVHRHAQKSGCVIRKPASRIAVFQRDLGRILRRMAGRLPCKCLCFVGQVLFQRIRRISLEHGADLRIGAVFPQRAAWHVKGNAAGLDDALYLQRLKLRHRRFPAQIPFFCLRLRFQPLCAAVAAKIKGLLAGAKPVCFGKCTLETVALDALDSLVQIIHAERAVPCCRCHCVVLQNFRCQKSRLIQRIITVDVKGRYLDHDRILSGAQLRRQIDLVNAVKAVRRPRRSRTDKFSIYPDTINAGCRKMQTGVLAGYNRSERQFAVHLICPALGPYWYCFLKKSIHIYPI